jgi:toxin ParE1/3/4
VNRGYILSRRAENDLYEIWKHIAGGSEENADRFVDKLTARFTLLGRNPYLGRPRDDLRTGIRGFPFENYLILYRVKSASVQVVRVMHGSRDLGQGK